MNHYEAKQAARKARLEARAEQAEQEARRRQDAAHEIGSHIPFGQPILVGHHSEKRHRRAIEKIDTNMRKAVDAQHEAERLADRAASVGMGGISSDDPDAVVKLQAELQEAETQQTMMKQVNALVRKQDRDGLAALGLDEAAIEKVLTPDRHQGYTGYPSYALSNNNATIRRIKQRIAVLESRRIGEAVFVPIVGTGYTITVDDNRVCLAFDQRLPKEHYTQLRFHGFLWSPTRKAFVRKYSAYAVDCAKRLAVFGDES